MPIKCISYGQLIKNLQEGSDYLLKQEDGNEEINKTVIKQSTETILSFLDNLRQQGITIIYDERSDEIFEDDDSREEHAI